MTAKFPPPPAEKQPDEFPVHCSAGDTLPHSGAHSTALAAAAAADLRKPSGAPLSPELWPAPVSLAPMLVASLPAELSPDQAPTVCICPY